MKFQAADLVTFTEESLIENFIFCAVYLLEKTNQDRSHHHWFLMRQKILSHF